MHDVKIHDYAQAASEYPVAVFMELALRGMAVSVGELRDLITTVDYYKDARSMIKQATAAKWT